MIGILSTAATGGPDEGDMKSLCVHVYVCEICMSVCLRVYVFISVCENIREGLALESAG